MAESTALKAMVAKSPMLELVRSPKYTSDGDIPINYVDWRILVTLSNVHCENCSEMYKSHGVLEEVNNTLTRILGYHHKKRIWPGEKEIFSASFDHGGAMWGYPETDAIEVKYVDGTAGKYLLERNESRFIASGRCIKQIPLAIHEKLQDEL